MAWGHGAGRQRVLVFGAGSIPILPLFVAFLLALMVLSSSMTHNSPLGEYFAKGSKCLNPETLRLQVWHILPGRGGL